MKYRHGEKDIGLFKHKGMTTDEFKVESISMANRLFNLNLSYTLTRTGKFNTKDLMIIQLTVYLFMLQQD